MPACISEPHGKRNEHQQAQGVQKASFRRFAHAACPPKISIFIWIVYHADRQKATRFVLFIQRTVTQFGFATENNYKSYPIGGGGNGR